MKVLLRNNDKYEECGTVRLRDGKAILDVTPFFEDLFKVLGSRDNPIYPEAGVEYLNLLVGTYVMSSSILLKLEKEDKLWYKK